MRPLAYLFAAVAAVAVAQCLTGCAALEDMPITIGVEGNHGTYSYSSKGGLVVRAKVRQEKSGRITADEIRERWQPSEYIEPLHGPVPLTPNPSAH